LKVIRAVIYSSNISDPFDLRWQRVTDNQFPLYDIDDRCIDIVYSDLLNYRTEVWNEVALQSSMTITLDADQKPARSNCSVQSHGGC